MSNTGGSQSRPGSSTSVEEPSRTRSATSSAQDAPEVLEPVKSPSSCSNGRQLSEKGSLKSSHASAAPQVATLSPPVGQFVINLLLQIAAFAAAIAFGIYAVKSVTVGNDANQLASVAVKQAVTSNQLAMVAVCLSTQNQVSLLSRSILFANDCPLRRGSVDK